MNLLKILLFKNRKYNVCILGGTKPNLADLDVYGILTAIQGCEAFHDLMSNTEIRPWFERMKNLVENHLVDNRIHTVS